MKALLNAYFSYTKDPSLTVQSLTENRHFGAAFAGYGIAALCWVVFFWTGDSLSAWGLLWRFCFFWLLEITLGYLWASLSGLFLNFFSGGNGPSALFVVLGVSGPVLGLLLCFAVLAAAYPWLAPLAPLVFMVVMLARFLFVLFNTARAVQVGIGKALGALCFAMVPMAAACLLCFGLLILMVTLL